MSAFVVNILMQISMSAIQVLPVPSYASTHLDHFHASVSLVIAKMRMGNAEVNSLQLEATVRS